MADGLRAVVGAINLALDSGEKKSGKHDKKHEK